MNKDPKIVPSPSGVAGGSNHHGLKRRSSCEFHSLTVADVYDIAADIGREFEVLIDLHGPECVTVLMQKTISALEQLERFAVQSDAEVATIENLRATVKHFELEEVKRNEERQRNDRELEQIEEHYKEETRDLLATVKRLQDENRKLSSSLAAATEQQRDSAFSEDEAYFEVDLVNRLQSVIDKQRVQIKKLDSGMLDIKTDNEELKCSNEKLTTCTRDLRRKYRLVQNQLHEMVDERAELTAKCNDAQRDIATLSRHLGTATKECEDLSENHKIKSEEEQLSAKKTQESLKGKIIYSENDPNRPRFTLPELKDILQERNSLKAKVSDLEDELAVFRPRKTSSSVNSPSHGYKLRMTSASAECGCSYHSHRHESSIESDEGTLQSSSVSEDPNRVVVAREAGEHINEDDDSSLPWEDLPVQGPLPQDPEDAPWRRNESGIRKLFRRVFGPNNTMVVSASTPHLSQFQADSGMASMGAYLGGVEQFDRRGHAHSNPNAVVPPPPSSSGDSPVRSLRKSLSRLSFLLPSGQEPEEY